MTSMNLSCRSCLAHSAALLTLVAIAGCGSPRSAPDSGAAPAPRSDQARPDGAAFAFRNAVNDPPAGWSGPVFTLSHDYPAQKPADCSAKDCPWLAVTLQDGTSPFDISLSSLPPDWKSGPWRDYIQGVLGYVRQGQDPQLANDPGFRVEVDGRTRWFHVPWMAYDPTAGREFVHGTTNERTAHLSDLLGHGGRFGVHTMPGVTAECLKQYPHGFETWSVGVYNEWGGWALGQAWQKTGQPKLAPFMGGTVPAGLPFPQGTVVAKFLTTNAPVSCVPYLKGSPEWQIHRHRMSPTSGKYGCEREVQVSRLVQVDIAVVDLRSPTRWVYGTFAYNGNLNADNVWDRLAPVGLQWGGDPWTFPAVPKSESIAARQSVLNTDIGIFQHFGCQKRLAGPVDNPMSSCLSCHASAYAPTDGSPVVMGVNSPSSFGFDGTCTQFSAQNVAYFQNQIPPQGYPGGSFPYAVSLDTSLQMWVAFGQYGTFNTTGKPEACTNPDQF